jgi:hypothetical protein
MNRRDLSTVAAPAALLGLLAMAPAASASAASKGPDDKGKGKPLELPVTGTLNNGQQFQGSMTNLQFSFTNGHLLLSGVLNGKGKGNGHDTDIKKQAFSNVVATLSGGTFASAFEADAEDCGCAADDGATFFAGPMAQATTPSCQILHLTLGPLTLNLLGLVLTIPNPIIIDLTAIPGGGNLLGNLLCALAHLLDSGLLSTLLGSLLSGALLTAFQGFLTAFLNALNAALMGL